MNEYQCQMRVENKFHVHCIKKFLQRQKHDRSSPGFEDKLMRKKDFRLLHNAIMIPLAHLCNKNKILIVSCN